MTHWPIVIVIGGLSNGDICNDVDGPQPYSDQQWCGLRPSVLGQDRSETQKIGLVLFCETRSCHARRHNDLAVLTVYANF